MHLKITIKLMTKVKREKSVAVFTDFQLEEIRKFSF